jgi:Family of unknown function (DUF5565)
VAVRKIISLYCRNYEGDRLVRDEVVPGAEWVLAGEGVATRKWDGTAVMVEAGKLYKRFDAKVGKTPPATFRPAQDPDPVTGHWPGWVEVGNGPDDQWAREAFSGIFEDGTYELVGPKVQGNPENFPAHTLVRHGVDVLPEAPRDFAGLRAYFEANAIEGIVWHRENGDMVKIKAKDFAVGRGARRR